MLGRVQIYTAETNDLRWSVFTDKGLEAMSEIVANGVFPWLRWLGGEDSPVDQNNRLPVVDPPAPPTPRSSSAPTDTA